VGDYCAKADIHARLQDLSTDYDALLDELCTEASQIFTRETGGRRFDKTTELRMLSGNGRRTLFIPDLAAITLLRVRTTAQASSVWRTVPLTPAEGNRKGDVVLRPEDRDSLEPAGELRFVDFPAGPDSMWPRGAATVEITGDWGYAAVPTDVKDACVELVVVMLRDRGVAGSGSQVGAGSLAQDGRVRTYPDITYRAMMQRKALLVA
jgi:hypothetical protein